VIFNPEFRRNIALQFTWSRLIAAPLVLLIPTYAFKLILDQGQEFVESAPQFAGRIVFGQGYRFLESFAELVAGIVIIGLWGTRRAADSLAEEVSGGTWDSQRMSGLGAWQMTWGKLIGSTSFVWYCAAIAALIAFWAGGQVVAAGGVARPAWQIGFDFAVGGVMAQAGAFAVGLILMRKATQNRRLTITLAQTCGLMLFVFLVNGGVDRHSVTDARPDFGAAIVWYGRSIDAVDFHMAMIAISCAWTLIGAYRLMRNELQYRSLPWVWTLFLLFVAAWTAGFGHGSPLGLSGQLLLAFLTMVGLTYLAFFADYRDPVRYRWALVAMRNGNWKEAVAALPWWVISYCFAAVLAMAAVWWFPATAAIVADNGRSILSTLIDVASRHLSASMALLMLFMLRDLLILLWLSCGPWRSRADVAGLIYLAVVYWPLAAIFWVSGGDSLLPVVIPVATGNSIVDFLPIAIELVFAAFLFYARWREITRLKPR
jgi:hypothetical protein